MPTDAELVLLARAGDRDALATIYDRYADRLYDLCSSVLRDPDAAFDTMVDTFVLAAIEIYRLRKPDKLESWLFALAREQLVARKIPLGVDEHAEFDGPTGAAAAVGAGAIVWEAVSWVPPRDRILLELHARQPLDDASLAKALGVSITHAAGQIRNLDERLERLMSALLVARLSRPGCPPLERLIAAENQDHPDVWLRHIALHVDVCRTCLLWREDQPSAIQLIKEVPREPAPPEVRDEVLDRIDLLWSELGPPDWSASVAPGEPMAVATSDEIAEVGALPSEETSEQIGESEAVREDETGPEAGTPGEQTDEVAAPAEGERYVEGEYDEFDEFDEFDEIESLLPPPPPLRRNGFPRRSMYPRRRRRVLVGMLLLAGVITAAIVLNFRGFGPRNDRLYADDARAAARSAAATTPTTTVPPTTAAPTTTAGPDIQGPFVFQLATVHGCIDPNQPSTTALATVADDRPGRPTSVELVFADANGTETRREMTRRAGSEYEAPIGPYAVDGNINWLVTGTDEAGNSTTEPGPAVAALSSC